MNTKRTIRNCAPAFRFQCPKLWNELAPTESAAMRHCPVCDCNVFFCKTDQETIAHAKAGHCIAREVPDEKELPSVIVGKPENPPVRTLRQEEAAQWFGRERAIDDSIRNADSDRSCPKCNYPAPAWRVTCRICGFKMGRIPSK